MHLADKSHTYDRGFFFQLGEKTPLKLSFVLQFAFLRTAWHEGRNISVGARQARVPNTSFVFFSFHYHYFVFLLNFFSPLAAPNLTLQNALYLVPELTRSSVVAAIAGTRQTSSGSPAKIGDPQNLVLSLSGRLLQLHNPSWL
jgi:hypothetical protein